MSSTQLDISEGSALIEQDSTVDSLFLVLEGEFQSEVARSEGAIEVEQIGQERWIGAAQIFAYESKSISRVIAKAPSRVMQLQNSDFWSAFKESPELASALTRELVEQMSESARKVDDMIMRRLEKIVT